MRRILDADDVSNDDIELAHEPVLRRAVDDHLGDPSGDHDVDGPVVRAFVLAGEERWQEAHALLAPFIEQHGGDERALRLFADVTSRIDMPAALDLFDRYTDLCVTLGQPFRIAIAWSALTLLHPRVDVRVRASAALQRAGEHVAALCFLIDAALDEVALDRADAAVQLVDKALDALAPSTVAGEAHRALSEARALIAASRIDDGFVALGTARRALRARPRP